MAIKEGDKIPNVKVKATDMTDVTTDSLFKGKKVVLFAVPGAFTPTCSAKHLPGFIEKADEIRKLVEEDEDIGVLVLGASKDPAGPGPLVTTLAGGGHVGTFPVPITVVPGHLSTEEILALA